MYGHQGDTVLFVSLALVEVGEERDFLEIVGEVCALSLLLVFFDVGGYAVDELLEILAACDVVGVMAAIYLGLHAAAAYDVKGEGVGVGGGAKVVEFADELGELGELGLGGG